MAFTAFQVFEPAQRVLQDLNAVRWPYLELAGWLTDGLYTLALLKPTVYSESYIRSLVGGSRQALNPDSLQLIRVERNIIAEGPPRTGGKAITTVDRAVMDACAPDWHNPAVYGPAAAIEHVIFDEADPRAFYVWPPASAGQRIETVEARKPARVWPVGVPDGDSSAQLVSPWKTTTVDAPDIYETALIDYVLARANEKDARVAGAAERAQRYLASFANKLGVKLANVQRISPKTTDAAPAPMPAPEV